MKEKKKQAAAMIAVLFCIAVFVCRYGTKNEQQYEASFFDVFDTQTQIIGYAASKEEFTKQVSLIKEKLEYYHKLYDIYYNYETINNLKTINDNAAIAPVKADKEIIALLKLGIEMYEKTNGKVNIAMGSVLEIWHDYRQAALDNEDDAQLPPMDKLLEAAEHTKITDIVIDEKESTVFLKDEKMSLDVGSIGKGYAVQKTAQYAQEELQITSMLFSVGGNVCAVGAHPDGTPWKIGIQNPDTDSEQAYLQKVEIASKSVVTSGNYQRYYMVDGKRYCHIINPDTLLPADEFSSVTVIGDDSGLADAYSTALFNMTLKDGMEFVRSHEEIKVMWILQDQTIVYSDGFLE